ncbi:class I SAM-dependent methyltransferase [Streptomyces sp. NPDC002004]
MAEPHTHTHDDAHDHSSVDWAVMGPQMERHAEVAAPMYTQMAAWVRESQPRPRAVVDAGSGPGVVSCLLADAFPTADVVAVDSAAPLLDRARDRAARQGLAHRVRTHHAELPAGLDGASPADILWAGRSLHHIGDQRAALTTFGEALALGGTLVLLEGGLPMRCLPRDIGFGRPGLQSRLDAAEEEWFTAMRSAIPDTKEETEDWPALLTAAGLRHTGTRTFLLDLPAPLTDAARAHVVASVTRRREGLADRLASEDVSALDRLLDPADDASLHHRPDVFLLWAQTAYTATPTAPAG